MIMNGVALLAVDSEQRPLEINIITLRHLTRNCGFHVFGFVALLHTAAISLMMRVGNTIP